MSRPAIEITLTDRIGALDEALVLVHDGFVESGYITPHPTGRRVIPHYLNPGTCFALAHVDGVLAGTCALIPDGPMGLPSEDVFADEFAQVREMGEAVEVGSLVVAPAFRAMTLHVVTMMFVAHLRRLVVRGNDSIPVCTVAPGQARFYHNIMGMAPIGEERDLLGAPAVMLINSADGIREWVSSGTAITRRRAGELFWEPYPAWLQCDLAMAADPAGVMAA